MTLPVEGRNSRDIGLTIAATFFLLVLTFFIPLVGNLSVLVVPLPVLYCRFLLGRFKALGLAAVLIGMLLVIAGRLTFDIWFVGELVLLGFTLGEAIERRINLEKTILLAVGSVMLTGLLALGVYSNSVQQSMPAVVSEFVKHYFEFHLKVFERAGAPQAEIKELAGLLETLRPYIVKTIPAHVFALFFFLSWVYLLLARRFFKRRALPFPEYGQLAFWRAPEHMIWGLIVSGLLWLLPHDSLNVIGQNGTRIFLTVYFFQGIAIVTCYFDKFRVQTAFRAVLYVLMFIQPAMRLVISGLGLFDMWFDFRKFNVEEK